MNLRRALFIAAYLLPLAAGSAAAQSPLAAATRRGTSAVATAAVAAAATAPAADGLAVVATAAGTSLRPEFCQAARRRSEERQALQQASQRKATPVEACGLFNHFPLPKPSDQIRPGKQHHLRHSSGGRRADEARRMPRRTISAPRSVRPRPRPQAPAGAEPERRARPRHSRLQQHQDRPRHLRHPDRHAARRPMSERSRDASPMRPATGSTVSRLPSPVPICGSPASTARSAPGCC